MTEPEVGEKATSENHSRGSIDGVIPIVGTTRLPQEFITAGKNFVEALGRTTFRDPNQAVSVTLYYAQMSLWNKEGKFNREIQDLTNFLNAQNAIGGYNKSLAAMCETGIYLPEGAGIKLSKDDRQALTELQKMKYHKRNEEEGKDEGEHR